MNFRRLLIAYLLTRLSLSAQGLLTNGSFEEGTRGWSFAGSWSVLQSGDRVVLADTGTDYLVSEAGNRGAIWQDLPTTPGQTYRIGASAGANRGALSVYWGGSLAGTLNVTRADGRYFRGQWEVVATSETTRLLLQPPSLPLPQWFAIDSISVVPEPSAGSLLSLGLLGICLALMRSQARGEPKPQLAVATGTIARLHGGPQ